MDAYGIYYRSQLVTLPDGRLIDFNGRDDESSVREFTNTARKYINDEYADFLQLFLTYALNDKELEEKKFDSDCEYIEAQNEEYRDALNEIESVLQQYESKIFDRKTRLYRKDLDAMLKAVHGLINEVV